MMKPEQFRQVANEALGGLTAGPALLNRARMKAAQTPVQAPARRIHRGLAMAMSLVLVIGMSALLLPRQSQPDIPVLETLQAGSDAQTGMRSTADLPRGSLVLKSGKAPAYQGVWERGAGANFPLLRVDGRYYRMLTHPEDVSALAGSVLGTVNVFMDEPALDNSRGLLSNIAPMDAAVYAVSGMGKAAVAAPVNGRTRLFQRVSFAGNALIGDEGLKDTLPRGAVTLQLSDVGTITDQAQVDRLMGILYDKAHYLGSKSRSGSQALLVQYANGLVLQMAVSGDTLSACGSWDCPEFIQAFTDAVQ
jgi:hypothetical protein